MTSSVVSAPAASVHLTARSSLLLNCSALEPRAHRRLLVDGVQQIDTSEPKIDQLEEPLADVTLDCTDWAKATLGTHVYFNNVWGMHKAGPRDRWS